MTVEELKARVEVVATKPKTVRVAQLRTAFMEAYREHERSKAPFPDFLRTPPSSRSPARADQEARG